MNPSTNTYRRRWSRVPTSLQIIAVLALLEFGMAELHGDLLVTSWGSSGAHGIYNVDEATGLVKPFPNDPASFVGLQNAQGVMIGPDGLIYAASSDQGPGVGSSIWTYDPQAPNVAATKTEFFAAAATRPINPNGLIFDSTGNLYVSDISNGGEILKYDPAGQFLGTHATGLGFVHGITFLPDDSGRMLAAAAGGHQLVQSDGSFSVFSQSMPLKSATAFNGGQSVAIDSLGNVLVSNNGSAGGYTDANIAANTVARFTPDGQWIEDVVVQDSTNTHSSGQGQHFGLLEGPEGDVFLTKKHGPGAGNYAVMRFDSRGLPSATGEPSFGGRDFHTGHQAFGTEERYIWLWDGGDPSTFGFSDPVTKQYVSSSSIVTWNNPLGGAWDVASNWAPNAPASNSAVEIAPETSATITGPAAPTTVGRLQIGKAGGSGTTTVELQASGPLSAGTTTIEGNGEISGAGQVSGNVAGSGIIRASTGQLTIGNAGAANQFAFTGRLVADTGGTLRLNYDQPMTLTSFTELNGGTLSSATPLVLPASGVLSGAGEITAAVANSGEIAAFGGTLTFSNRLSGVGMGVSGNIGFSSTGSFEGSGAFAGSVAAAAGSSIAATGDLAMGNELNPNGFIALGSVDVGSHAVALRSAAQATLGGTTRIAGGELIATNGIRQLTGGTILLDGESTRIEGGTFSNAGHVRVVRGAGHEIAAALDNQPGGSITTVDGLLFSGANNVNNGQINVLDATLTFQQALVNGPSGEINAINATLQLDGGLTNQGTLNLINATVVGDVAGTTPIVLAGSNFFTGDVTGAFDLTIQLRDANGDHDQLVVDDTVEFGGMLNVTLRNGFAPVEGNEFVLSTYGARIGEFDTVTLPPLHGFGWELDYASTELTLSVVSTSGVIGDLNGDGRVDRADVAILAANFGRSDAPVAAEGDINGDGVVSLHDVVLLQQNFTPAGSLSAAAVPEPTSVSLLVAGAIAIIIGARSHRRRRERRR